MPLSLTDILPLFPPPLLDVINKLELQEAARPAHRVRYSWMIRWRAMQLATEQFDFKYRITHGRCISLTRGLSKGILVLESQLSE